MSKFMWINLTYKKIYNQGLILNFFWQGRHFSDSCQKDLGQEYKEVASQ